MLWWSGLLPRWVYVFFFLVWALVVRQLVRQLVYQVCYARYHVSFYLWLIGSVLKHCKVPKFYEQDCRHRNIKHNFKDFPSHYARPRSDLEGVGLTAPFDKTKNPHDIFINLDVSIETATRPKNSKVVALVKWLTKKGIEKIQEEHQQVIPDRDNQIKPIQYENTALQIE